MDFNLNINFEKILNNIKNIIKTPIEINKNTLNDIFITHLNNDKKINIKTYANFYQNPLLTEYIGTLIKPNFNETKLNDKIFEGNIKINSYQSYVMNQIKLKYPDFNFKDNLNKFVSSQSNNHIKSLINFEQIFYSKQDLNSNILTQNLLVDNIKINNQIEMFDIIIFNVDSDIHNIIHAKCCEQIKKIKIRGTS